MPGGVIEGIVREHRTGTPVPGAVVTHAREAMAGLGFGERMAVTAGRGLVTADGEGRFRITGLSPGAIRLSARAAGLATREPTVVPLGVAGQLAGVEVFVGGAFAVRGTVTIEGAGPAAGVEVEAEGAAGVTRAVADAKGHFAIEGLPPGDVTLSADGPDMLEADRPVRVSVRDRDIDGVKLTVRAGATIVGRVEPAGVAEVGIKRDLVPAAGGVLRITNTASTLTAPDGTFSLGPVEPGTVVISARATDGRRGQTEVAVPPAGATGVLIHLETLGGLSGRVVTTGGTPLAGVSVHARRVEADRHVTMIVNGLDVGVDRAPTGAGGQWEILGLAAGNYELTVHDDTGGALAFAGEGQPPSVALKDNERKDGIELTVQRNDGVIKGTVLSPEGQPLPDAWVSASAALELPSPKPGQGPRTMTATIIATLDDVVSGAGPAPVLTDANGRFEIAGLRQGNYRLLGEGLSGAARGMLEAVPTGSDVSLPLSALTRLEGKVTAAGKPVDEFTVELSGAVQRSETFHAAGGAFTMARVDPGSYTVKVTAPEGSGQADVTVTSAPATQVAVALVGFAKVIGKVIGPDGAPLVGAAVVAAVQNDKGMVRISIEGEPPATAADGSFSLDVSPGKHVLIVLGKAGPAVRKPFDAVSGQVVDLGTLKVEPPAPPPAPPAPQKARITSAL
jgi:protocatechuate 3,4-dioxygenase beta subunit